MGYLVSVPLYLLALFIADLVTDEEKLRKFIGACFDFLAWLIDMILSIGLYVQEDIRKGLILWGLWIVMGVGIFIMFPSHPWIASLVHLGIVVVPSVISLGLEHFFSEIEDERVTGP